MKVTICNGCGQRKRDDEVKTVALKVTSTHGETAVALQTMRTVAGELCPPCIAIVENFVGETTDEDAEDARTAITPGVAAV
jgi:hypothetical protein